jgi:hypothetical protein
MSSRISSAIFLALVPIVAHVRPVAANPVAILDPHYAWTFEKLLSDGVGSVQDPAVEAAAPGEQVGGELDESFSFVATSQPQMQVFSNQTGTTFWAFARSPFGSPDLIGTPLGSRTTFTLTQTFQVVADAPTLSFTISEIALEAFDPPGGPGNDGLSAYLSLDVVATDQGGGLFFAFLDETELTGEGLAWNLDDLSGPLTTQIVQGGEDQSSIRARLTGPFTQEIDLSLLHVRDIFSVRYTIVAEAIDTEQFDSRIAAFARDPLDPGVGSFFTFAGLEPISVPEPGAGAMLLVGLAALGAVARRRAARGREESRDRC